MDPDVLLLIRDAQRELHSLIPDLEEPGDWDARTRSLLALQGVAATLVDAARQYAEQLSGEAGSGPADSRLDA